MGASFADELAAKDPRMIPHPLPDEDRLAGLIRDLPLKLQSFKDEKLLYLCVLDCKCR
jgi:hypothetical protein